MKNSLRSAFIITLVLCLAISMISCKDKKDPDKENKNTETTAASSSPLDGVETEDAREIYSEAKEKTDSLSAFCAELDVERTFDSAASFKKDISKTVVNYDASESLKYKNEYSNLYTLNDGTEIENTAGSYFSDSLIYEKTADGKKTIYFVDEATEASLKEKYSNVAFDFPADIFEKSVITEGEKTVVTAYPEASKIEELLQTFSGDMNPFYTPADSGFSYEYNQPCISFTVGNNGCFDQMTITFPVCFDHLDSTTSTTAKATVDIAVTLNFTDTDGEVTVEAPDDLVDYSYYDGSTDDEKTQAEYEEEYMNDVMALFDSNNNKIADFNKRYAELCLKYGRAGVDSIVSTYETLSAMEF